MYGYTDYSSVLYLVLMTRSLAILCKTLQCLVDESYVVFIDVEPQKPQPASCTAANTVQELQCLTHQVVVGLVRLVTQVVLQAKGI